MPKQTYGNSADCYVLPLATVADTAAHVSGVIDLRRYDEIALQLIAGGGAATLDGAWKIEVSNDFMANATASPYGQAPNAATAHWTDITAQTIWSATIAAVAHGTASSTNQYVQALIGARAMRITFTGTTGSATVGAILYAKSWS